MTLRFGFMESPNVPKTLAIARKLKIPRVIFPVGAGVMSALGLLISALAFEVARSRRIHVEDIDAADFEATFRALEADAKSVLLSAGMANRDIGIKRRLDMRYQGQGHEIEVSLPDADAPGTLFAALGELFGGAYQAAYTLRLDEPIEIVNWKVEAAGPVPDLGSGYKLATASEAARSSCTSCRDSSPLTQRRPGTVTLPSSVTATL